MKRIFCILNIIGILIIIILSVILNNEPFKIIDPITLHNIATPTWLYYSIIFSFIYTVLLWCIYEIALKIYKHI